MLVWLSVSLYLHPFWWYVLSLLWEQTGEKNTFWSPFIGGCVLICHSFPFVIFLTDFEQWDNMCCLTPSLCLHSNDFFNYKTGRCYGTIALSNCTSCGAVSSGCSVPACPAARTWEWRLRNLFLITSNCPSLSTAYSRYTSSSLNILLDPSVHPQQVTESCLLPVAGSTPGLHALSTASSSLFTAPLLSKWCYPPSPFLSLFTLSAPLTS